MMIRTNSRKMIANIINFRSTVEALQLVLMIRDRIEESLLIGFILKREGILTVFNTKNWKKMDKRSYFFLS